MLDFTKPVQTRKGLPARVLCTDRAGEWAVVALVGEKETVMLYTKEGRYSADSKEESGDDLVNVPEVVERVMHATMILF